MASKELQAAIDAAWRGICDKTLQWDDRRKHLATMLELQGEHEDATLPTGYSYTRAIFDKQISDFAQGWPYGTGNATEADADAARAERDPPLTKAETVGEVPESARDEETAS